MKYCFRFTSVLLVLLLFSCSTAEKARSANTPDSSEISIPAEDNSNKALLEDKKHADDSSLKIKRDDKASDSESSEDQNAEKGEAASENPVPENNPDPAEKTDTVDEEKISSTAETGRDEPETAETEETPGLSGADEKNSTGNTLETERSLPVKEGVQRTTGTGWARRIADAETQGNNDPADSVGETDKTDSRIEAEAESDENESSALNGEEIYSVSEKDQDEEVPPSDMAAVLEDAEDDKAEITGIETESDKSGSDEVGEKEQAMKKAGEVPEKKADKIVPDDSEISKTAEIPAAVSEREVPETLSESAGNDKNASVSSEKAETYPRYEAKASEYLDALENERIEGREEGKKGRQYILSFKEGSNADDKAPSGIKGGGVDNRASEKAAAASYEKEDKSIGETPAEEKRGEGDSRERVVFEDPSHITVILDGTGWIFLGEQGGKNITFLSRTVDEGKTVFSFRAGNGKVFILNFQFQNTDGSSRNAEIELASKDLSSSEKVPESSLTKADAETDENALPGKVDLSVSPVDEKSAGNTAPLNTKSGGDTTEADYNADDVDNLFKEALDLIDKQEYIKATENLEKIRNSSFPFPETDRLYFLLGQCYEKERDPVKAEDCYRMLLDQFPFSIYYDSAETRKRYLLRYFIDIK